MYRMGKMHSPAEKGMPFSLEGCNVERPAPYRSLVSNTRESNITEILFNRQALLPELLTLDLGSQLCNCMSNKFLGDNQAVGQQLYSDSMFHPMFLLNLISKIPATSQLCVTWVLVTTLTWSSLIFIYLKWRERRWRIEWQRSSIRWLTSQMFKKQEWSKPSQDTSTPSRVPTQLAGSQVPGCALAGNWKPEQCHDSSGPLVLNVDIWSILTAVPNVCHEHTDKWIFKKESARYILGNRYLLDMKDEMTDGTNKIKKQHQ